MDRAVTPPPASRASMASAAPPVPALPRRRRQGRPGATHAGYNEGETAAWAYVGVDACRAGWVAVRRDQQGKWDVGVYPRISDLLEAHRHAVLVLIDMPIGLPDGEQVKFRACDELAAAIVGRAKVFAVPPRPALEADDVRTALAIARRLTGKGFFLVWRLKDRIFEVEEVLGSPDSPWRGRLREAHPEVCFASLRRGPHGEPAPAVFPKHTPAGCQERLAILAPLVGSAVLNRLLKKAGSIKGVQDDDVLDAAVLAVVAWLGSVENRLATLPLDPPADPMTGLPMEMVYLGPPFGDAGGRRPPGHGDELGWPCGKDPHRRLTLHEAILIVLICAGRPLTPREIADLIEKKGLYRQRSGRPVTPQQVRRRMRIHRWLFEELKDTSPRRFDVRRSDPCRR